MDKFIWYFFLVKIENLRYNLIMKKKTSYITIVSVMVFSIIIDLVTKIIFANLFSTPREDIVIIPNFLELTYLENTGAAFGMFSGNTVVLIIVSIIMIGAFCLFDYFNHKNDIWYSLGLALLVGGAIGNLIDRIFLGYVRDFINMKIFPFVFNLADAFITFAVIFLGISIIKELYTAKKGKKNELDNK